MGETQGAVTSIIKNKISPWERHVRDMTKQHTCIIQRLSQCVSRELRLNPRCVDSHSKGY